MDASNKLSSPKESSRDWLRWPRPDGRPSGILPRVSSYRDYPLAGLYSSQLDPMSVEDHRPRQLLSANLDRMVDRHDPDQSGDLQHSHQRYQTAAVDIT